jgi:SAM-dependent methyltransferase
VPDAPDLDALLAELRARVDQRRRDGFYPPGVEQELQTHFEKIVNERPPTPSFTMDELEQEVNELQHYAYSRGRINIDSNLPGGHTVHRAIGKTVSRQVQGVLDQAQDQSRRVAHILALLVDVTNMLTDSYDGRMAQQLDDLQARLAEQQRDLHALVARLEDVAGRLPGVGVRTWYPYDHFATAFRGEAASISDQYGALAARFVDCSPVLDIGFGRGEFLDLLHELGVEASGIEVDPTLVSAARARGLDVSEGRAVEHLLTLPDASLGGIVMIQVIEHLTPQHIVDVVKIAADKLRRGGRLVMETINPGSMFAYAHALWVDPDHVRPVHPDFLAFLCREAGFAEVERIDRSPVPTNESLELLPGDDEATKRLNVNFERINALLFAPQDYAIVATR